MTKPDFKTYLLEGVHHFNSREFWEAHESWETIWLAAESEIEQYLQGLIQVAAAYHHVKRGTFHGAIRLFDAGLRRLDAFPMQYCGIDRSAVDAAARRQRAILAGGSAGSFGDPEYPELILLTDDAIAPPLVQW